MRVLMIADVVARSGRKVVLGELQKLREQYKIDICTMNCENVSGGFSITPANADQLFAAGIDIMTSGNHIFDKPEIIPYLNTSNTILRPANYPSDLPGEGLFVGEINGYKIAIFNLLGRVFMPPIDEPFRAAEECLKQIPDDVKIRLVDMHCEATSEKYAMGWFLNGRVSAVVGSHTHIQTADERILDGGTAYITDIGMTGSYNGCIGMNSDHVIERFMKVPARRADHCEGDVWICAVVIDIDEETGKAVKIERLRIETTYR
jgi:2',3'-cyclic-nucleotide 2'-phosphodiesterase